MEIINKKSDSECKERFVFSVIGLDHIHIMGMSEGLIKAGAHLKYVYDPDRKKIDAFKEKFPKALEAASYEEVLEDDEAALIAGACVPNERCNLGLRILDHGKHYFCDKAPMTTLAQLESARAKVMETGKKYMVYYGGRLHVESAIYAGKLIKQGAIGRVLQVTGLASHRLNASGRPDWFFEKEKYGGIICDIGSHQIEQYLYYSGEKDATVVRSHVTNHNHPQYPELEDLGEVMLVGENGTTNYFRVDWFTPDALRTFGDERTFILGTDGYIELRKFTNIGTDMDGENLFLVNHNTEKHFRLKGMVGTPFFRELISDCINGTENAMTQEHAFKAAELCLKAQLAAKKINLKE